MDLDINKLIQTYKPNAATAVAASRLNMLATVGPSASGKTTIMRELVAKDSNFSLAVGESSRPQRKNEQVYLDMIHRGEAEIITDVKDGNLFQVVMGPNGHLYCTRPQDFDEQKINLYPLIPLGVRQFRALNLQFFATAFIVPASFERWLDWLNDQAHSSSWTPEQKSGRLTEAKTSYEFALNDPEMHFVLNDEIDQAASRLRQVGLGRAPDDEIKAREIARENFAKLIKI